MRRAKIVLRQEQVARMLDLPEGVEIYAVEARIDPPGFYVHLTGDAIPEAIPDAESPFAYDTRTVTDREVVTEYHVNGQPIGSPVRRAR